MWNCWPLLGWQGKKNSFRRRHYINLNSFPLQVGPQLTGRDSFYNGAVLVHQALMDLKDAEEAGAPILALPSKDEPDMVINFLFCVISLLLLIHAFVFLDRIHEHPFKETIW